MSLSDASPSLKQPPEKPARPDISEYAGICLSVCGLISLFSPDGHTDIFDLMIRIADAYRSVIRKPFYAAIEYLGINISVEYWDLFVLVGVITSTVMFPITSQLMGYKLPATTTLTGFAIKAVRGELSHGFRFPTLVAELLYDLLYGLFILTVTWFCFLPFLFIATAFTWGTTIAVYGVLGLADSAFVQKCILLAVAGIVFNVILIGCFYPSADELKQLGDSKPHLMHSLQNLGKAFCFVLVLAGIDYGYSGQISLVILIASAITYIAILRTKATAKT